MATRGRGSAVVAFREKLRKSFLAHGIIKFNNTNIVQRFINFVEVSIKKTTHTGGFLYGDFMMLIKSLYYIGAIAHNYTTGRKFFAKLFSKKR